MRGAGVLLQDGRGPSVRSVIGRLLARSRRADFAVMRIRLAAVDLKPAEIARIERCRVLVGRLDAAAIVPAATMSAAAVAALIDFIASGRAEIRAAAGATWFPDFSVVRDIDAGMVRPGARGTGAACLVGAHFFAQPFAVTGPAFTALLTDERAVAAAAERFEALWDAGYDVGAVVASMLAERAAALAAGAGSASLVAAG